MQNCSFGLAVESRRVFFAGGIRDCYGPTKLADLEVFDMDENSFKVYEDVLCQSKECRIRVSGSKVEPLFTLGATEQACVVLRVQGRRGLLCAGGYDKYNDLIRCRQ